MNEIFRQLINLAIQALITALVWRYYKTRQFPVNERYLTFGPRFWTGAVDACVIWPVGFVLTLLLSLNLPTVLSAILVVIENLAWLVYTVVMHGKYGQTVGKMVTKVRVVDHVTEGPISYRQACLREGIPILSSIGLIISEIIFVSTGRLSTTPESREEIVKSSTFWWLAALPGLWFLAEVLTMLTNDKRRALHDYIAGTVVVRTNTGEETTSTP